MFSAVLSDVTGGSDVTRCVPKEEFPQQPFHAYVLPDELAFIFLVARKEQFIFTDKALIVIMGDTAASTKRLVTRYEYNSQPISHVMFETAGVSFTDGDCEIKFTAGSEKFSIDINKKQTSIAVQYYRALVDLSKTLSKNKRLMATALTLATHRAPSIHINDPNGIASVLTTIAGDCLNLTEAVHYKYECSSYREVFERHGL